MKISWKRNGIEMINTPSNKILLLSSTTPPPKEIRKLSQCNEILFNLSMEHFWRQTRFLLLLQQDENWRNMYLVKTQGHRNNECLFKKYFTAFFYVWYHQTTVHNGFKSILAPKYHAFSRDFYEKIFLHKDENWRNVSWKHNGIEIRNAPSNKILLLSSTPYHQTKYLCKQRFHNGIIWIFN